MPLQSEPLRDHWTSGPPFAPGSAARAAIAFCGRATQDLLFLYPTPKRNQSIFYATRTILPARLFTRRLMQCNRTTAGRR